jgi:hypothetical protein
MTMRDLNDDDALQDALGRALDATESGSSAAEALARSAVDLGQLEVELAELVSDSYADERDGELALRAVEVAEGRTMAFRAGHLTVDLDIDPDGRTIVGQVTPAAEGEVDLVVGAERSSAAIDALGRFLVELPPGPFRAVVRTDGAVLTTPWITR